MELIDRERLKRDLIDNYNFYPSIVKNALEKQPSVDAVEVVRCGECRKVFEDKKSGELWCYGRAHRHEVRPNDFCSYGERREKNE